MPEAFSKLGGMKRICVFTGSNPGAQEAYGKAAQALGRELVSRGLDLVYGGARVGLMGLLADEVLAAGGEVHGVMPHLLYEREVGHEGLTELHLVDSMHERKAMMAELADGFIAMPGGAGTMEELFEVFTWAQLGMHQKPLALLNVAGYYDGLIAFLSHAVDEGFLKAAHMGMLLRDSDPGRILDDFADYVPPTIDKWVR